MSSRIIKLLPISNPRTAFYSSPYQARVAVNGICTAAINIIHVTPSSSSAKSKGKGKSKKNKSVKVNTKMPEVSEPILSEKLQDTSKATSEADVGTMTTKEEYVPLQSLQSPPENFEGKEYKLKELAQIVQKNSKTLVVNFTHFPQAIPDVLKAIQTSGLNLKPKQNGTTLYVLPKDTKEHIKDIARDISSVH